MSRIALLVVAAALFAVSTAAVCGEAEDEPVSDEVFRWNAQVAAQQANLTIEDFPDSWTSEPQDPDEDDDDDEMPEGLSPECVELFETFEEIEAASGAGTDENPQAESDDFESGDGEGVSTEVEVFRTLDRATETEDMLDEAFGACGDDLGTVIKDEVNKDAEAEGEEFRVAELEMLEFSERDLGDWARDWGFTVTYQFGNVSVDATITMTFVREGRMAGTFSHFMIDESDEELIDEMRTLFAERLAEADNSLPK